MIDTHVHSEFSADSTQSLRELVRIAAERGVTHLALTDHQENEFHPSKWSLDFSRFFALANELKREYAGKLVLSAGVEIGFAPPCNALAAEQVASQPFDTVVNSVHNIDAVDLFYEDFYRGKTKREAYDVYLRTVLESIRAPYWYSQVGHIGYIARYARYDDRTLAYEEHREVADEILREIIRRDVVLELNTSAKDGLCVTPPDFVRRYYELGGRRIAPASDAHDAARLCDKYRALCDFCREIGFSEFTFTVNRRYVGVPI